MSVVIAFATLALKAVVVRELWQQSIGNLGLRTPTIVQTIIMLILLEVLRGLQYPDDTPATHKATMNLAHAAISLALAYGLTLVFG